MVRTSDMNACIVLAEDLVSHRGIQCLSNQATRKYLATVAGSSGSEGSGSLSGDALLSATQDWLEARRSVLSDMAINTAEMFPLAEGFNLPKKIAIITLVADADDKLNIASVESFALETFLSMAPHFRELLDRYIEDARSTDGCPGLAVVGIRCGLAARFVPTYLSSSHRERRGPFSVPGINGRPLPWHTILNVLPFLDTTK